jgi:putative addiction module component (TIGR02574 family)
MTNSAQNLISQLQQLSVTDRAELAYYLLHSLDNMTDAEADATWEFELHHRLNEIQQGTAVGDPAESVFAQLCEKYA